MSSMSFFASSSLVIHLVPVSEASVNISSGSGFLPCNHNISSDPNPTAASIKSNQTWLCILSLKNRQLSSVSTTRYMIS